jgi:hypothetical protein
MYRREGPVVEVYEFLTFPIFTHIYVYLLLSKSQGWRLEGDYIYAYISM